ncbi:MAG: hypothetical protein VB086_13220 [Clostridiaceae bacterium]|nr:hypothetical protein [Clostridiaceae bacterium]
MNGLQAYLLRLTAAGLICAGVDALCGKGKKELVRFCCACVLALVALAPLSKGELQIPTVSYEAEVQAAVDEAVTRSRQAQVDQTQQALARDAEEFARSQYDLSLTATIVCSEAGDTVEQVVLQGDGGTAKAALTAALAQRFGISAEAIQWEG